MNHLCAYVEGTPKQLPARVVAILDECDLSVLSQGLNVSKTEIVIQEVLRLMFQLVLVTATSFANAFTCSNLWTFPGSVRRGHAADAYDVYVLFTDGMKPRICGK